MSVEKFLKQRAVNIAVGGSYTLANWYDRQGKPRTFACRTTRVSPFRMLVQVPVIGKIGSPITSYFSDFPLGNSAGRPHDPNSQAFTLELALRLLETAPAAQTTVQSPLRWSADASWKRDYNNVALLGADELARRRREFDAQKQIARGLRESAA